MSEQHTPTPWRAKMWSPAECGIVAQVNGKEALVTGYALNTDAALIVRAVNSHEALVEASEAMLVAFAEGVVWNEEQRAAYEAMHATLRRAKGGEGA